METLQDFYNNYKNWFGDGSNVSCLYDGENNSMSHLTWEQHNILYSITAPHEGNDFTYLLRVNPKSTFDKWGNVDIEEFYDTIDELAHDLEYRDWIYRSLMWLYIDRYAESINED